MRFSRKKKREVEYLCASFVDWLLDNHYEVIAPLLNQWKEETFDD